VHDPLTAKLALGTVQWGLAYGIAARHGQPGEGEVAQILQRAQAAGITTLDTARVYGASEQIIGRLLGPDPTWTVVTKVDPAANTASGALDSIQASRSALQRPVLDAVLLHRAQQRTSQGGLLWDALRRERDAGRIGMLGVSALSPDEAWEALDEPEMTCLQVASSLFDQRLSRAGFFEAAERAGRTVFVRSVFLQGVAHLTPDDLPAGLESLRAPLQRVHDWASAQGVCFHVPFLAFAAGLRNARVLFGCETARQLEDNLEGWSQAINLASLVLSLLDAIPALPAAVLDPAQW
jgi:aryl-alcohol dehydrogenase-like predicted oxidoreductase